LLSVYKTYNIKYIFQSSEVESSAVRTNDFDLAWYLLLCPSFHFWFLIYALSLQCVVSLREGLSSCGSSQKKKKQKTKKQKNKKQKTKKQKTALPFLEALYCSLCF